jgi:hypothetical protein
MEMTTLVGRYIKKKKRVTAYALVVDLEKLLH